MMVTSINKAVDIILDREVVMKPKASAWIWWPTAKPVPIKKSSSAGRKLIAILFLVLVLEAVKMAAKVFFKLLR
jgi:hypothetical protein